MRSAFGVEHGIAKSYLGAGKWGRAVEAGAKRLRAAPSHASAKGVTDEDAFTKDRLTGAWQAARRNINRHNLQAQNIKGRSIYYVRGEGPGEGATLHLPTPGKSQRQASAVVRLPEGNLPKRKERLTNKRQFKAQIDAHLSRQGLNPADQHTAVSLAARHLAGKQGFISTEKHENVHALTHRKPLSFAVRANQKPRVLWGEEARADSVMTRGSRKNSGYREMSRTGLIADDDLNRQYNARSGPMRYRQVERELKRNQPPRTFAVSTKGEARRRYA